MSWCLCGGIAVLVLALAAVSLLHFRETPPTERILRYTIAPPEKSSVHSFALSPDGRHLAIAASVEGKRQLWVRALEVLQPQLLAGTEDAQYPFWSPDGRYIGFFAQGKLRKIAVTGGPAQTLCDAADGRGGAWNRDGVIIFTSIRGTGLQRVPAAGGVPAPLTQVEGGGVHRFPVFLPDGRHFLYLVSLTSGDKNGIHVASLDNRTGRHLLADNSSVSYLPPLPGSSHGQLLFIRESTLMAQPFDPKTLQITGDLFPVADQVGFGFNSFSALVSVSDNGVLAYQTGRGLAETQLTWYDRGGKAVGKVGARGGWGVTFALSADERTVAVPRFDARRATSDLWLHEVARGADTRFTFHASRNATPIWSPDGKRLIFSSDRAGRYDLYEKDTSGAGQDRLLLQSELPKFSTDWSRDGRLVQYTEQNPKTRYDLWVLPLDGDRKPAPFLQTEFNEAQGQWSPDGRWIAYASDESGRYEVYVRPFPSGTGKWKVSLTGGHWPRWSNDGKEIFYLSLEHKLLAVPVRAVPGPSPVFEPAAPQELFEARIPFIPLGWNAFPYAVAADGKRFLVATSGGESADTPLTVVVNWPAAVKK